MGGCHQAQEAGIEQKHQRGVSFFSLAAVILSIDFRTVNFLTLGLQDIPRWLWPRNNSYPIYKTLRLTLGHATTPRGLQLMVNLLSDVWVSIAVWTNYTNASPVTRLCSIYDFSISSHNYLYSIVCAFRGNSDSFTDLPQENEGQK